MTFKKKLKNPFACNADQHFENESQMPDWAGLILEQIPCCTEKDPSQISGGGGGGGGRGLGIDWFIKTERTAHL